MCVRRPDARRPVEAEAGIALRLFLSRFRLDLPFFCLNMAHAVVLSRAVDMPNSDEKDPLPSPWVVYTFDPDGKRWSERPKLCVQGPLTLETEPVVQRLVFEFKDGHVKHLQIETKFLLDAWNNAVSANGTYVVGATKVDGDYVFAVEKPDGKSVYFRAHFENDGASPHVEILGRPRDAPRDMEF